MPDPQQDQPQPIVHAVPSLLVVLLADFVEWVHTDEFGLVEPNYERDRCERWAREFLAEKEAKADG